MTSTAQLEPIRRPSKRDVLCSRLKGLALQLGPDARLPTVVELCAKLDVAKVTLDGALRRLESERVLVCHPGRGIFVSPTIRQKTLGVVFGGNIFSPGFSPFWSLLLQAVQDQARGRNLVPRAYLDISEANGGLGGHAQLVEDLDERRLDGVLLLSPQSDQDEAGLLRKSGIPFVVFGGAHPDWCVTLDWDPFLRAAARELAPAGCRRIGLIGPPAHAATLAKALREAGAGEPVIADWSYETWASIIPGAGTRENCAHRLTEQMIAAAAATPLPDTLVSMEDTATRGAITALLQAGLQPSRNIRIVTTENKGSSVLEPYAADITRVAIDPRECMKAALEMLTTLMNGGTPAENPVRVRPGAGV